MSWGLFELVDHTGLEESLESQHVAAIRWPRPTPKTCGRHCIPVELIKVKKQIQQTRSRVSQGNREKMGRGKGCSLNSIYLSTIKITTPPQLHSTPTLSSTPLQPPIPICFNHIRQRMGCRRVKKEKKIPRFIIILNSVCSSPH